MNKLFETIAQKGIEEGTRGWNAGKGVSVEATAQMAQDLGQHVEQGLAAKAAGQGHGR